MAGRCGGSVEVEPWLSWDEDGELVDPGPDWLPMQQHQDQEAEPAAWREAFDGVRPGSTAHELIACARDNHNSKHRLVHLAAKYDDELEWFRQGEASAAHWIGRKLQISVRTASEWSYVGHMLKFLPALDRAFESGELSYSQTRVIARHADESNVDDLIEIARNRPADRLNAALAKYLHDTEDEDERDHRHHEDRGFTLGTEPGGMTEGRLYLPALEGHILSAVLDHIIRTTKPRAGDKPRSLDQQRADALMTLVQSKVELLVEMVLHIRGDGNTFDDGTPLSNNAIASQLPDSFIRTLIHDTNRNPIDASNRRRHPTQRQQRVVHERDHGECTRCGSTMLLHYHHNPEYEITRHTITGELELLCGPCHRAHHRSKEQRS